MRNCKLCGRGLACVLMLGVASAAQANIVFENTPNNGWFTPFNASNAANVKYGDSGWIGTAQPSYTLTQIDLGVVSQNGTFEGTTDIKFTLNDGDPSGLVFGTAAELYSTTITGVALPSGAGPNFFTLTIPLPNIATLGGFNNVGWSIGLENYNFDGEFGFQASTASGQTAGFYTNNASFFDGANWSLFSFGGDPETGVANFVATIQAVPEPSVAGLLAVGTILVLRRRRA